MDARESRGARTQPAIRLAKARFELQSSSL